MKLRTRWSWERANLVAYIPASMAILIATLWAWGVQQHNLELFPHDSRMYTAVHRAAFGLMFPVSLIAHFVAESRGFDIEFIGFTVAHAAWGLLTYIQWYAIVCAPGWLRRRRATRAVILLFALAFAAYGMGAVVTGVRAAKNSEHDLWWHIQQPVCSVVFAAALVVLVVASRRGGDQPAT